MFVIMTSGSDFFKHVFKVNDNASFMFDECDSASGVRIENKSNPHLNTRLLHRQSDLLGNVGNTKVAL